MDHLAILDKKKKWLDKILAKEKTIESRWYKTRRTPWDRINKGDTVYFKNSGQPVTAKAQVSKVLQFENWNQKQLKNILIKYGQQIDCQPHSEKSLLSKYYNGKKYCILVFLENPIKIKPFEIDKTGYGLMAAWINVPNIKKLEKNNKKSKKSKIRFITKIQTTIIKIYIIFLYY